MSKKSPHSQIKVCVRMRPLFTAEKKAAQWKVACQKGQGAGPQSKEAQSIQLLE